MKHLLLAGGLLLLPSLALAVEIDVGGTPLSIPAPAGYGPITSDMMPYARLAERFVPPQNVQFALFLPAEDAALAAAGGVPTPKRHFYVQTAKSVVHRIASMADFAEAKRGIKTQNEVFAAEIEERMPGFFRDLSQGISRDHDVEMALSLTQLLPLAPHHESAGSLAYSMIAKYEMTDAQGDPYPFEAAVTITLVLLKGKVMFLYATADRSELAWTREASREWAAAVAAANPSSEAGPVAKKRSSKRGFDWGEVLTFAVIGAAIGAVIGVIKHLGRKKAGSG